jgi:hypothetical protein
MGSFLVGRVEETKSYTKPGPVCRPANPHAGAGQAGQLADNRLDQPRYATEHGQADQAGENDFYEFWHRFASLPVA